MSRVLQDIEWKQTAFDPSFILPRPWAEDEIDPEKRGPWASIACGDAEVAAYVVQCLNEARPAAPEEASGDTLRDWNPLLWGEGHDDC